MTTTPNTTTRIERILAARAAALEDAIERRDLSDEESAKDEIWLASSLRVALEALSFYERLCIHGASDHKECRMPARTAISKIEQGG